MKMKQMIALLMAVMMIFAVASCGQKPTESDSTTASDVTTALTPGTVTTDGTTVAPIVSDTTESGKTPVTPSDVLETQKIGTEEIVLPLDEIVNAINIEAAPVTETMEIPLLLILANFDADGDGVNDWDPNEPDKLYKDKSKPYYGEQWAASEMADHYHLYFDSEYSLSNFYEEMTMGAFRFVPLPLDVVPEGSPFKDGIVEVTVPMAHPSTVQTSANAQKAITMVFNATDPYVDYSKLDKNHNGRVDNTELAVVILNPGQDHAYGTDDYGGRLKFQVHGTSQGLSSNNDGMTFFKVSNFGEYARGGSIMQIGTPAHELAHNLGAEDLYDTRRNGHGGSAVQGWPRAYDFSLECNGNHLGGGSRPAYLDPYHRLFLGWAEAETVTDGVYTIHDTLSDKAKFLRINTPDPGEYYIVEIRLKDGFESQLTKGPSKGGIMVWHIDQDLCDRFFVEGSASTSTSLHGERHDPAIVPLFRDSFDDEGRYMTVTSPNDPFYYYDEANPAAAVFESGIFHSVTNGTQSLNSYPDDWEGPENYNLRIEVLSAPGHEMTVKITSGRKDFPAKVNASYTEKSHNSITVKGDIVTDGVLDIEGCAVALSTSPDFTENLMAKNAEMASDGNSFSVKFDGLTPETKYYYKAYMVTDRGYAEGLGNTTTSPAPKEKSNVLISLYPSPDARPYGVKVDYGKTLTIPQGWLNSIARKNPDKVLDGWYYDKDFTKPFDMTTAIAKGTEDFDLYAKWVPKA